MGGRLIRVLQVVGGLERGGVETWLRDLLRCIDRSRLRLDFLVHSERPGAYEEDIRALESGVIPCLPVLPPWFYARSLGHVLETHGPYDVVHGHLYLFNALPLWVAARHGVPVRIAHMYPVRDTRPQTPARSLYRRLAGYVISRSATLVLAPSRASLEAARGLVAFGRQPAAVLHVGVDLARFARAVDRDAVRASLGLPRDRPVVAYVARFMPHKNHAQVLRVADRLNRAGSRVHFALAGSHGDLLPRMREAARSRPYLSVLAGLADVSDLLEASDVFFLPSLEEGFGIAAIEAAAAGLPIVATDLPALRESCPPSHHAFLYAPDDDAVAASHLLLLLGDAALRERLGADARRWASRFSIASSAAALTAIYDDALARRALPPSTSR